MTELTAAPNCCEEAHWTLSRHHYVPCNAPATRLVQEPNGGPERRMCSFHAAHSVDNRRFTDLGDYKPREAEVGGDQPAAEPVYDYSAYADAPTAEGELAQLSNLAEQQRHYQDEVKRLEGELKKAQGLLADVAEHKIPELMDKVGMEKFSTRNGLSITVSEAIRASMGGSDSLKEKNLAWLREEGHEAIIKMSVVVPYGRGEANQKAAAELAKKLRDEFGLEAEFKQDVHAGTLSGLVRELLEDGRPVPEEQLGVFRQRKAKVTEA